MSNEKAVSQEDFDYISTFLLQHVDGLKIDIDLIQKLVMQSEGFQEMSAKEQANVMLPLASLKSFFDLLSKRDQMSVHREVEEA